MASGHGWVSFQGALAGRPSAKGLVPVQPPSRVQGRAPEKPENVDLVQPHPSAERNWGLPRLRACPRVTWGLSNFQLSLELTPCLALSAMGWLWGHFVFIEC